MRGPRPRKARAWGSAWLGASVLSASLVGCGGEDDPADAAPIDRCDWPMWGHDLTRTFSYPCQTELSPETASHLEQAWFFNAEDTVTATPAVVDGRAYVGDWSGNFYALDLQSGQPRWTFEADVHPRVYAGQIVSSAAVADIDGTRTVYFAAGKTLYALHADDGSLRWRQELGPARGDDPREIESSPVVVDGLVIFGSDVHNSDDGTPAGVHALDAATGRQRWMTVTAPAGESSGGPATGAGCADVWGSPSVDLDRRLVFVGTGNCTSAEGWGANSEAILALDLDTGERRWGFQPHDQNLDDLDFAGAPNLFEIGDRAVVGLGGKDGVYHAVDRETGEAVWQTQVAEPGVPVAGNNYSTGGFIGPTAVADGIVVGGTAVGGAPYLHALDAETGDILWQQDVAAPTYAAALEANGVVVIGGTDFVLRAIDVRTGDVLWHQEMSGAVSGGAVIVPTGIVAVAGIREPGVDNPSEKSGVYLFTLDERGTPATTSTSVTPTTDHPQVTNAAGAFTQPCVAAPCPLGFDISAERVGGDTGSGTVEVSIDPFRVEVRAEGLGPPERWLRSGSPAAAEGATVYGVYLSQGTDNPVGGLVCVLDENDDCVSTDNPAPGATYDRVSILAVAAAGELPSITEGVDRIVTTNGFDVPFAPAAG